ncbi:tail fiber protein [Aneurinibacillus sp. BA2021]|nr:tail fiber protein [Aneurinibacillus sp. BA2021]
MDEQVAGEIRLFPYHFAPVGWKLCDGSELNLQQNAALFSLITNKFGLLYVVKERGL